MIVPIHCPSEPEAEDTSEEAADNCADHHRLQLDREFASQDLVHSEVENGHQQYRYEQCWSHRGASFREVHDE